MNIVYGEKETAYLAARDKRLGAAIAQIGHVERAADPDVFASVVHHIIGQQISTAAQATVCRRLQDAAGTVDAASLLALDRAAFDRCRRYAPYATVASLDLWAIARGAIPELTDPAAPRGRKQVSGCRVGEDMV